MSSSGRRRARNKACKQLLWRKVMPQWSSLPRDVLLACRPRRASQEDEAAQTPPMQPARTEKDDGTLADRVAALESRLQLLAKAGTTCSQLPPAAAAWRREEGPDARRQSSEQCTSDLLARLAAVESLSKDTSTVTHAYLQPLQHLVANQQTMSASLDAMVKQVKDMTGMLDSLGRGALEGSESRLQLFARLDRVERSLAARARATEHPNSATADGADEGVAEEHPNSHRYQPRGEESWTGPHLSSDSEAETGREDLERIQHVIVHSCGMPTPEVQTLIARADSHVRSLSVSLARLNDWDPLAADLACMTLRRRTWPPGLRLAEVLARLTARFYDLYEAHIVHGAHGSRSEAEGAVLEDLGSLLDGLWGARPS